IESIVGVLEGGIAAWTASGRRTSTYATTDVDDLHRALEAGSGSGLDVRQDAEWTAGHVPGARHLHVADLPGRVEELRDMAAPVYVYCRTGHRAAVAASIPDAAGISAVHGEGRFPAWVGHGPLVTDTA